MKNKRRKRQRGLQEIARELELVTAILETRQLNRKLILTLVEAVNSAYERATELQNFSRSEVDALNEELRKLQEK